VMLSAETAIGSYPVLAAETMARIARLCQERGHAHLPAGRPPSADTDADALAYAAVALAGADREIAAIACYTRTGRTARILSALRPRVPILAYSPDDRVHRRLALVHGVIPRACVPPSDISGRLGLMAWLTGEDPSLADGAAVVLVASTAEPGSGPNLLEVHRVRSHDGHS
jgi:pyruvate kinase